MSIKNITVVSGFTFITTPISVPATHDGTLWRVKGEDIVTAYAFKNTPVSEKECKSIIAHKDWCFTEDEVCLGNDF